MKKQMVALFLTIVMLLTLASPAVAADGIVYSSEFSFGSLQYLEQRTVGNKIILTSYLDGAIYDRATWQIGSDHIIYKKFSTEARANIADSDIQIIPLSDLYVDSLKGNMEAVPAVTNGYAIKTGNIGSVKYRTTNDEGATMFRSLSFSSTLAGSALNKDFEINKPGKTELTIILSAVITGFSGLATSILARMIISAAGATISGTVIAEAFKTQITGNCYKYNVKATASDGRTSTQSGETYYGTIKKGDVYLSNQLIFANYSPDFIEQRNSAVATWFHDLFWIEIFNVENFYPA